MEDTTIISYSRSRNDSLLSLTESRSRYMLPFGGCFRVVDFTIQNAVYSGAKKTIIFNDFQDELEEYVARYGSSGDSKFPAIKVVSREFSDINFCHRLVSDSNTAYYIIYNGDNPSIIDFRKIINKFKNNKTKASLFKLKLSGTASMAHTILVTGQKYLLSVIKTAIKSRQSSPNIFEMIINIMINNGIKNESVDAYYWPMKSVPDYYNINMEILKNPAIASLIFHKSPIKSFITEKGQAILGINAKVANSIVSDNCKIFGTVMNSILFPGVEIGENTFIKDSIILPNNIIGPGSYITKTIIDERTDRSIKSNNNSGKENKENNNINNIVPYFNVGSKCNIGKNDGQIKNNEFPSLNGSLSLIGKNCRIQEGVKIGGACYIASGKGESYFLKNKHLYNGLSILN
jgi:glucose-1-phosphate adenylyltransferase